jgi:hypothetical protein
MKLIYLSEGKSVQSCVQSIERNMLHKQPGIRERDNPGSATVSHVEFTALSYRAFGHFRTVNTLTQVRNSLNANTWPGGLGRHQGA